MNRKKYFISYLLPGILLIIVGFITGLQDSMIFSMLSFVSFFTVGVMLIIEGKKRCK